MRSGRKRCQDDFFSFKIRQPGKPHQTSRSHPRKNHPDTFSASARYRRERGLDFCASSAADWRRLSMRARGPGGRLGMKCGKLFLKNGNACFDPTVDFQQHTLQRELLQSFAKAGQYTHDDTASLGSRFGLAGASCLACHHLAAGLTLAAIVGRLHFGV